MSILTNKTEYGTVTRKIEFFVNVPYLLHSIGSDYKLLTKMKAAQNLRMETNPDAIPRENEVSTMERCLDNLERKANLVQEYLNAYQISIHSFNCKEVGFFVNDMQEFRSTYRAIINNSKAQLCAA